MKEFNPYHRWLQIPPSEQPPSHYRLLGLVMFESESEVIDNAADQRIAHLRTVQSGPNGRLAQNIINEVSQARIVLLNAEKKAKYDAQLRAEIDAEANAAQPPAPPKIVLDQNRDDVANLPSSSAKRQSVPSLSVAPARASPKLAARRSASSSQFQTS